MMRIITLGLSLAVPLFLSACSATSIVNGFVPGTSERFNGTATGYLDRTGVLNIVSTKGTSCQGDFVYTTSRTGKGTLTCNDGRSGAFEFVSTGRHGTGEGKLGDKPFTFTFEP